MKLFLAFLVAVSILLVEVPVSAGTPVTSSGASYGPVELHVLN
jgi:hypothetical protein